MVVMLHEGKGMVRMIGDDGEIHVSPCLIGHVCSE